MLKRNLVTIAIAIMGLAFTSNAFGQAADWEIKPAVKKPTATVKKPTSGKGMRGAASGQANRKKQHKSLQAKDGLGNFEIQMAKKPTSNLGDTGNSGGTISNQRTSNSSSRTRKPVSRSTNQKIVKKTAGWSFGESQHGTQVRRVKKL